VPLARVLATLGLMTFVLSGIEWRKLLAVLGACDWRWWAAGMAVAMSAQGVAAVRWAALARPIGFPHSVGFFVWRFFEGQFFNLCLPSSIGGDVVKAYRLADSTAGRLLAGCTVLADRLTGLTALAVLAGTALLARRHGFGPLAAVAAGAGLMAAAAAVIWILVGTLNRLLEVIPEQHPSRQFISRLLPYQERPALMTQALGWSLLVQMGGAVAVALMARALGVTQPLSVWFVVVPLVALAMVVPISIAGVGIREEGLEFLLKPDVLPEQAVAIGLLWFLATILTGIVGGVLFLLDRKPVHDAP
jgi:hypothetical protein